MFDHTVAVARDAGIDVVELEPWPDVDDYDDLLALWRRRGESP